jgi:HEAT repeat protein
MSARDELVTASHDRILRLLADAGDSDIEAVIYEAGRRRLQHAVGSLIQLVYSPSLDVRQAAVEALGEIGNAEAAEVVLEVARETGLPRAIRDTVAWVLGTFRYLPALPQLVAMLKDSEPTVRSCAAAGLTAIGSPDAVPWLRLGLHQELDPKVRADLEAAIRALAPSHTVRLVPKPDEALLEKIESNDSAPFLGMFAVAS